MHNMNIYSSVSTENRSYLMLVSRALFQRCLNQDSRKLVTEFTTFCGLLHHQLVAVMLRFHTPTE
jgi:hypothetical protein